MTFSGRIFPRVEICDNPDRFVSEGDFPAYGSPRFAGSVTVSSIHTDPIRKKRMSLINSSSASPYFYLFLICRKHSIRSRSLKQLSGRIPPTTDVTRSLTSSLMPTDVAYRWQHRYLTVDAGSCTILPFVFRRQTFSRPRAECKCIAITDVNGGKAQPPVQTAACSVRLNG